MSEHEFDVLFRGVVGVRHEDGFFLPLRFTEKQYLRYLDIPRCPYPYATAGVELDFYTDADSISFRYSTKEIWNWWEKGDPSFDLYENGEFAAFYPISSEGGTVTYRCRSAAAKKRITVYFPGNAAVAVAPISIGTAVPTPERKRKFLILGDSISQGLMGNSASFSYTQQVKRFFDADMLNASVGGDCFDVTALDPDNGFIPTDVIVALGTNDTFFLKDHAIIVPNMKAYLELVKTLYADAEITVISPPWLTDGETTSKEQYQSILRFSEEIYEKATSLGFRYVDGGAMVPHDARFFSDTAHPNDLGFSQYALHLIKRLLV